MIKRPTILLALVTSLSGYGSLGSAQEVTTPAGLLMNSMFSPQNAPPHKTMGLAQRSFLDVVEESEESLQVAIVLDGTESMQDSLADMTSAITNMMQDLKRFRGNQISFQLVVYRDTGGGAKQPVQLPLNISNNDFTTDTSALTKAISEITAESGAPYFHELVDLGLHQALTELNWNKDENTARWIILFGDAPPYASGFREKKTNSSRRIETGQLISLANRLGISIHCVLCTSRPNELEAYKSALNETQTFMGTISTRTGGLFVDLSYDDIRKAIESTRQKPKVQYRAIAPITEEDVMNRRRETARAAAQNQRARIAVLPHLPIKKMSFDIAKREVLVAAELRHKLRSVRNTDVSSTSQVRRLFTALQHQSLSDSQFIQTLANGLKVDYVVWGSVEPLQGASNTVEVKSAIFGKDTGQKLVEYTEKSNLRANPAQNVTNNMASELMRLAANTRDSRLASVFQPQVDVVSDVVRTVSSSPSARDLILAGFELVEQAIEYPDEKGDALLAKAEVMLRQATTDDPRNPTASLLLANCYFNQARSLAKTGDAAAAKRKATEFANGLKLARESKKSASPILQTEIEADYALFIRKDGDRAITEYSKLTNAKDPQQWNLHTALRAHWMLAGIYSGDWNVAPSIVDADKARDHLIEILANWPESYEASFIRRNLRWNEQSGETRYPHIPLENKTVSQLIET